MSIRAHFAVVVVISLLAFAGLSLAEEYSWNQPQSRVTPQGDIEWSPRPFEFKAGDSLKYIDYEAGNDANVGAKDAPWKHHPWDPQATGNALACRGVHTYVFKRGVIYRGKIFAKESGRPGNPIRLTSDPAWGKGAACLYGSERIAGGWKRCTRAETPDIAQPEKVWYQKLETPLAPRGMWLIEGDKITRINLARDPNWTIVNPDDPQTQWYEWESQDKTNKLAIDSKHLTRPDAKFYEGGILWTETYIPPFGNMDGIVSSVISQYNPAAHAINAPGIRKGNRYFIENVRALLDEGGEFFYSEKMTGIKGKRPGMSASGRDEPQNGLIYVRLPGDKDPNAATIEISARQWPVEIQHQSNIEISGLSFAFDNHEYWGTGWPEHIYDPCFVRVVGDCRNITIANCGFNQVVSALRAFPRLDKAGNEQWFSDTAARPGVDFMDNIVFSDNDISHSERQAIVYIDGKGPGGIARDEVPGFGSGKILRNRFYFVGFRRGSNAYNSIPVIGATNVALLEVGGNVIDTCWGSGIHTRGPKQGGDLRDIPLGRALIYHNKVVNSMLGCNDYGGIATWQGGTQYVYNNVSGNCIGYKNDRFRDAKDVAAALKDPWLTQAENYYIDGGYKNFLFNNIAWGKNSTWDNPYRNRAGFNMVLGYMNHWFNNTANDLLIGLHGSSGQRNSFLGNVLDGIHGEFISQNRNDSLEMLGGGETGDKAMSLINTNIYGYNVLSGKPREFVRIRTIGGKNIQELAESFKKTPIRFGHPGWYSEKSPLRDSPGHDFRPLPDSAVIDRGVKYFVPWSLYATVGEWNFYQDTASPQRILGENFYMTDEYMMRDMYLEIPRNDLMAPGATLEDYVSGELEDWGRGAMAFDGHSRYCVLADKELKSDYQRSRKVNSEDGKIGKGISTYPGAQRKTVDIGTDNFLIEIYFRVDDARDCVLVAKEDAQAGYRLFVTRDGLVGLRLTADGKELCSRISAARINDGKWHHVLVEVERQSKEAVTVYVDGKVSNNSAMKGAPAKVSLSNTGDFYVGRSQSGEYFKGAVDFLRLCRGTLADAHTTIEELYTWQFHGPFLRDMRGISPKGKRDAGALELEK